MRSDICAEKVQPSTRVARDGSAHDVKRVGSEEHVVVRVQKECTGKPL
jgi:hypothetical protein